MKQTKTYNYFPVRVPRLLSHSLRCSLGLSFALYSLLFSAALLTSCSDDPEEEILREHVSFEAMPCTTVFKDVEEARPMDETGFLTRTWPPSPYVTYETIYGSKGMFANQKNMVNKSIGVFFTNNDGSTVEGTFSFRESDSSWRLNTEIETKTYYLYGFIPREDATSVSITPNGSYSNGAVLTIHGLNTVTPSDVCAIVGAKNGISKYDDGGLRMGDFEVEAHATNSSGATGNFIYLLFDHLYSALRFSFKVDAGYNEMRTIKLRKLEMTAYDISGGVKAKYDAIITLQKNPDASPITNVSFSPVEGSAAVSMVTLYEWDNDVTKDVVLNPTTATNFMGCFVPGVNTIFKIRSTYDVYDKKQMKNSDGTPKVDGEGNPVYNLLRENCVAENTFDLRNKFTSEQLANMRGNSFDFTITVQPTYLYVLSEPDMDNPTMTIN